MSAHKPEPWEAFHLYGAPEGHGYVLRFPDTRMGGVHHRRMDTNGSFIGVDADRIVACVNACAGIRNDQLADLNKRGETPMQRTARMLDQLEELAAAPTLPPGFTAEDLKDVADGLLASYEVSIDVGEGHIETTTAYAARFIRAILAAQ